MNLARFGVLGLIVLLAAAACEGGDPETGSNATASTTAQQAGTTTEQPTATTQPPTTTNEPTTTTQLVDLVEPHWVWWRLQACAKPWEVQFVVQLGETAKSYFRRVSVSP